MRYKIDYIKFNNFNFDLILNFIKSRNNFFQVVDAKSIISELQIINALKKTDRYFRHNKRIKIKSNIFLMYLGYTTQISSAIDLNGIHRDSENGIVIYEKSSDFENFLNLGGMEKSTFKLPYDKAECDKKVFMDMAYIDLLI
ncbi:KEOPS complex subunit Cgi121 [Acidiplasma sp.]|uniref:KEOPS complex subunit Cgi121 n=1 Tax=Acidiplasma sp. TaxID=1872114 RepID=UPI003166BD50